MKSDARETLALAVPLAAQQLGFQLMGVVDAALLGRYKDASLAGATVGNNLLFAITSVAFGVVMGLDTVIPQRLGAGLPGEARRALSAGIRLAIVVGIASTLLVIASPYILVLADVEPDVRDEATVYTLGRALGVVPFLVGVALRSYLAAKGVTRPLIIAVVAGNLANAALDTLLIFGAGLGVIGAAAATTVVQIVIMFVYLRAVRGLDDQPLQTASRADMAEIAGYGLPVGGQILAEVGIFGVATVLAAHLGTLPAAGHGVALNISSFSFSIAFGIASATSVRVGHAVGANDLPLARRRGAIGIASGLLIMSCWGIAFIAIPHAIGALFSDDEPVRAAAIPLLQIAAVFQLSDGTQAIAAGALRGLGDTRATLYANLAGHYAIGLPISLALAFGAGMGAPGLWWGLSAGLTVTAVLLVGRFVVKTRSSSRSPR